MAYSQTEALEIAKDDTAQLQLIDSFIDHTAISQRIQDLRESLGASDLALAQALAAGAEVEARTRDVATHEEQIRQLDEVLKSERHAEIRALQPKTECLEEMATHVEEIRGAYDGLVEAVEDCEPPALNEALKTESALKDLHKEVSGLGRGILKSARSLGTQVDALSAKVEKARREWKKHVDAKNEEYRRWLAQQGGDRAKLEQKRKGLAEAKEKASKALKAAKTRAAALRGLQTTRTVMLSDLSAAENALYELRRQKYAEISGSSKGRLQLQIERNGSRGQYHQALSALKKGTNLHDSTIAQVVAQVDPRVLVGYVLEEDGNGLAAAAGIAEKQGQKLVTYLHALEDFAEVLRFEHEPLLRDTPQILYRKDDGQDYDLAQLSVGQKFTALLIIALVEGNRRIIIDQPEDALDIPSVYEDLTLQLRAKKSNRQFILTTHSPAVAVAGDWDQFHVLKATARSATVAVQGAMDRPVVCLEVMQHLEGGAEPFALKTKKYALRDGKS